MALEKQIVIDRVEVLENNVVQVRYATRIIEDGVVINAAFHRELFQPGDDYSKAPGKVQAICSLLHDADCIKSYAVSVKSI